jgi:hypothetical protein
VAKLQNLCDESWFALDVFDTLTAAALRFETMSDSWKFAWILVGRLDFSCSKMGLSAPTMTWTKSFREPDQKH